MFSVIGTLHNVKNAQEVLNWRKTGEQSGEGRQRNRNLEVIKWFSPTEILID